MYQYISTEHNHKGYGKSLCVRHQIYINPLFQTFSFNSPNLTLMGIPLTRTRTLEQLFHFNYSFLLYFIYSLIFSFRFLFLSFFFFFFDEVHILPLPKPRCAFANGHKKYFKNCTFIVHIICGFLVNYTRRPLSGFFLPRSFNYYLLP